jgi:hypothetical protein
MVDNDDDLGPLLHNALGDAPVEPGVVNRIVARAQSRRGRRWVREAALTVVVALIFGTGLGVTLALRHSDSSSSAGQVPAAAMPCQPGAPQPSAARLTAPEDLSDVHLGVVEPAVQPKVTATDALNNNQYQSSPHMCAFRGVLAYFSSSSTGTVKPECAQAPPVGAAPACSGTNRMNFYTHELAWVFTWRNDCGPASRGAGASPSGPQTPEPSPAPFSCATMLAIDANTGQWIIEMESGLSLLSPPIAVAPTPTPTPLAAPCDPSAPPQAPYRLSAPKYLFDTQLTVVEPSVQPKVSAADALARSGYQTTPATCGLREVLAYVTAASPATIRPECVPQVSPWTPPASCANGNDATPIYTHVLAWVFTWRMDCGLPAGPALSRGQTPFPVPTYPPLSCATFTLVDATTGQAGFRAESGAPDPGL